MKAVIYETQWIVAKTADFSKQDETFYASAYTPTNTVGQDSGYGEALGILQFVSPQPPTTAVSFWSLTKQDLTGRPNGKLGITFVLTQSDYERIGAHPLALDKLRQQALKFFEEKRQESDFRERVTRGRPYTLTEYDLPPTANLSKQWLKREDLGALPTLPPDFGKDFLPLCLGSLRGAREWGANRVIVPQWNDWHARNALVHRLLALLPIEERRQCAALSYAHKDREPERLKPYDLVVVNETTGDWLRNRRLPWGTRFIDRDSRATEGDDLAHARFAVDCFESDGLEGLDQHYQWVGLQSDKWHAAAPVDRTHLENSLLHQKLGERVPAAVSALRAGLPVSAEVVPEWSLLELRDIVSGALAAKGSADGAVVESRVREFLKNVFKSRKLEQSFPEAWKYPELRNRLFGLFLQQIVEAGLSLEFTEDQKLEVVTYVTAQWKPREVVEAFLGASTQKVSDWIRWSAQDEETFTNFAACLLDGIREVASGVSMSGASAEKTGRHGAVGGLFDLLRALGDQARQASLGKASKECAREVERIAQILGYNLVCATVERKSFQ